MKQHGRNAYRKLKALGVPVFERSDLIYFGISAEDSESYNWLDYYCEHRGHRRNWEFGVNPIIVRILDQFDLIDEWENPGSLAIHDN